MITGPAFKFNETVPCPSLRLCVTKPSLCSFGRTRVLKDASLTPAYSARSLRDRSWPRCSIRTSNARPTGVPKSLLNAPSITGDLNVAILSNNSYPYGSSLKAYRLGCQTIVWFSLPTKVHSGVLLGRAGFLLREVYKESLFFPSPIEYNTIWQAVLMVTLLSDVSSDEQVARSGYD